MKNRREYIVARITRIKDKLREFIRMNKEMVGERIKVILINREIFLKEEDKNDKGEISIVGKSILSRLNRIFKKKG